MTKICTALTGIILRQVRNAALHQCAGFKIALAINCRHLSGTDSLRILLCQLIFIDSRKLPFHKIPAKTLRMGKGIKAVGTVIETSLGRHAGIKMLLCHIAPPKN